MNDADVDAPPMKRVKAKRIKSAGRKTILAEKLATVTPDQLINGAEAAALLRVSDAVISRAFNDGKLTRVTAGGKFGFLRSDVEEFGRRRLDTLRGSTQEALTGQRDARVWGLFEKGVRPVEVVVQTQVPCDIVMALHAKWLNARKAEGPQPCSCGAASDPITAVCATCFSKSRKLTDQERALLAGQPLPDPRVCECAGCLGKFEASALHGLCAACAGRLTVNVRGGCLVVMLGAQVVRTLSADDSKRIAAGVTPAAAPVESRAAPAAPTIERPVDDMIAELQKQHGIDF